jgi:hypothetical protein
MIGRVKAYNKKAKFENATILYFKDKLYIRHAGIKPSPFAVFDAETLEENTEESTSIAEQFAAQAKTFQ